MLEETIAPQRAAIERTYFDTMIVRRPRGETEGSITRAVWEAVGEDTIPCAFSRSGRRGRLGRERSGQTGGENVLDYDGLIFCASEADIAPGDRVTLTRETGETLDLETVGRPVRYPTHQEVGVRELKIL